MMCGRARDERPNLGQPGLAARQLVADDGHQAGTASSPSAEDGVGAHRRTPRYTGKGSSVTALTATTDGVT